MFNNLTSFNALELSLVVCSNCSVASNSVAGNSPAFLLLGIRTPVVRLAVIFILSPPNYKRSLELLLLNGHCFSPTCAKPIVLVAQLTLCL